MIRNVVFDFGQVLVRFEPEGIALPDFPDPADRALAVSVLFDRAFWDRLDDGSMTEADVLALCLPKLPARLHAAAENVLAHWFDRLPPVDGMWELVRRLQKEYGIRAYLLSNISKTFPEHLGNFPILGELDGCVFSGKIGLVKPSHAIFAYLCRTYGLDPAETLFVDDNENNIKAASAFGMNTYLFDGNAAALSAFLEEKIQ